MESDPAADLTQLKLRWQRADQIALSLGAAKGARCNAYGGVIVKATCSELYDLEGINMSNDCSGRYTMSGCIYGLSIGTGPTCDMKITKTSVRGFPPGYEFTKTLRVTRPFEQNVEVKFTVSSEYAASPA